MAKAGSHILSQFLEGLSTVSPFVYTDLHPIRTITPGGSLRSEDEVLSDLRRLEPGDMAWGYIPGTERYIQEFVQLRRVNYFVYRDPRDKIISTIKYAMDIHEGHAMREYFYAQNTMEERITAVICGVPGYTNDIRTSYGSYLAWFDQPQVMCISFEELVNEREASLERMLSYLEDTGVSFSLDYATLFSILNSSMSPERSPTFRRGTSGGWRDSFTEKNKDEFKQTAGDLLIRLGYESSNDW